MARPSTSTSVFPPGGSSARLATLTKVDIRELSWSKSAGTTPIGSEGVGRRKAQSGRGGCAGGLRDQGSRDLGLDAAEHSGQAANPEHAQDLGQATPLDQIAGNLQDLFPGRTLQALHQHRD